MSVQYGMPSIERESVNGIQQISLITDLFTNRNIFLFGEINEAMVYSFTISVILILQSLSQLDESYALRSSWIFRRGEKPFLCRNLELDTYLMLKGILKKETATGPITKMEKAG